MSTLTLRKANQKPSQKSLSNSEALSLSDKVYIFLLSFFCINLVLANLVSVKLFQFHLPFFSLISLPVGDLVYPVTFLITDIISEVWGKKRANQVVINGFFTTIFAVAFVQLCIRLSPSELWFDTSNPSNLSSMSDRQAAYEFVFSSSLISTVASLMAYVVSQRIDVSIYHYIYGKTGSKWLWLRNNVSTMTAQLVDTLIFGSIFYYFGMSLEWSSVLAVMVHVYTCKVIYALLDTPLCYVGVFFVKKVFQNQE